MQKIKFCMQIQRRQKLTISFTSEPVMACF